MEAESIKHAENPVYTLTRLNDELSRLEGPKGFCETVADIRSLLHSFCKYSEDKVRHLSSEFEKLEPREKQLCVEQFKGLKDEIEVFKRAFDQSEHWRHLTTLPDWKEFFLNFMPLVDRTPRAKLREVLQEFLLMQKNERLDSPEERKEFAVAVNDALVANQFRVVCPGKPGEPCGEPAAFRSQRFNERDGGIFFFTHGSGKSRASHGFSAAIPELRIVPAPTRMRESEQTGVSVPPDKKVN